MTKKSELQQAGTPAQKNAALILADGAVFFGFGVGKKGSTFGEVCFNTSMSGYQEIITDPSYTGQIITFTFPHIGNVGTNDEDIESKNCFAKGIILRTKITNPSNFRNTKHFDKWLSKNKITGISGVDTRALTNHIRTNGPQNVAIVNASSIEEIDIDNVRKELSKIPSMKGLELAGTVTCKKPYVWKEGVWKFESSDSENRKPKTENLYHVVAIDFGAKLNILRCLVENNCKVTVVPSQTSAEEILKYKPDGIFLSNGPGDPAATGEYAVPIIKKLLKSGLPIFGICLGHQLLSLALGCKTKKMHQGHRGANHPVINHDTKIVEITSQNHGFVVLRTKLPKGVKESHQSLFDKTLEGIKLDGKPVFSVQHHPEASPGPRDSYYLFKQFVDLMEGKAT